MLKHTCYSDFSIKLSRSLKKKWFPGRRNDFQLMLLVYYYFLLLLSLYVIYQWKSGALPAMSKPTIRPNRPKTEPKISITKILTKRDESAASEMAAVAPVTPTQTPQIRLAAPTVIPAQNSEKPVYTFSFVKINWPETTVSLEEKTMAIIKP